MKLIQGGITAAKGFKAAGEYIGIKNKRKDLAIIYSEIGCTYAGAFTQNVVKAAPVIWDKAILEKGNKVHAIVVNSGNANAATGEQGLKDTEKMASCTAKAFGTEKENVLVCSTGVIGVNLPMEVIEKGISSVAPKVEDSLEAGSNASEAILTTDTASKVIAVQEEISGMAVTVGGMGKGSGMIHPNMATMLGFITTDANITQPMLQKALKKAIDTTFNMITVDGDTSTNDSVLVLANGVAGNALIDSEGEAFDKFFECLYEVCKYIAISIVKDGEGATKLLEVELNGAASFEDGKALAKSILTSSLVKTAFFGEDANWGRIFCAMGYSGIDFDPNGVDIAIDSAAGHVSMLKQGLPVKFSEPKAKEVLEENEIKILITMNEGSESVTAWGCDLSYDYVKINGDYRS
ncbi:MAG: arginine biosynthesis bifunctional protein ArgJ [Clostridia bacterium]|jgi:glutamate N-acetyltransferase/amino-acid N-acetyltransferase|nr:arginine biosynthesis bifunctional protein ArgJ [Clostridia bacterium]